MLSLILILLLSDMYACYTAPKTRQEARCSMSIDYYNKLLEYDEFKSSRNGYDIVNYAILQENMHIYNNECKTYSDKEDKLIDELYDRVIEEHRRKK